MVCSLMSNMNGYLAYDVYEEGTEIELTLLNYRRVMVTGQSTGKMTSSPLLVLRSVAPTDVSPKLILPLVSL